MEYKYEGNTNDTYISYFRNREGPNGILVYYKNVSRFVSTSKGLRDVFGSARYTDSVKSASKWADEMIAKYDTSSHDVSHDEIVKDGFGPEAHKELEPNDNTRMVT
jgi:hypothetical protein